jgi:ankyrin repeat protein
MNASSCPLYHLKGIYDALKKRGVDCKSKDIFGKTALHYAVISESIELVELLLTQSEGYDPNEVDNSGHTPLSLYFKGTRHTSYEFYNPVFKRENIF